jgi:IMP dehydrogenase/GMP reductase
MAKDFFGTKLDVPEALTFDDVLLRPMESRVEPDQADTSTRVSRSVELTVPVLSAAMDTVTEREMAIAMARAGGLGVLHRNMAIEEMTAQIRDVKRADELVIRREDVVTASPDQTVQDVDEMMESAGVSGAPVVDDGDRVLGIISGTDIRPYLEVGERDEVREAMTEQVITAPTDVTTREALELMYEHKIERVPIVDDEDRLTGLVTMQSILQRREHEQAARDDDGALRVGVAVGPFEADRAAAADEAGEDRPFYVQAKHLTQESPLEFLTWEENALMLAELAAVHGQDISGNPFGTTVPLELVNMVRTQYNDVSALPSGTTVDQELILGERDKEFFATIGLRLVDMRRTGQTFIRQQFDPASNSEVNTGEVPGPWRVLPITDNERNQNENFN